MKFREKVKLIESIAVNYKISEGDDCFYDYGDNPYMDIAIENALMCDMFPEETKSLKDRSGFDRSKYILIKRIENMK